MSAITSPVLLDSTGQSIVEKLHTQNMLLDIIAGASLEHTSNLEEIAAVVKSGKASDVFSYGDQIIVPWTDVAAERTYSMPFNVVHFGTVTLGDGEEVPGMYLQAKYAHPFGVQFDAPEAIQYFEDGLAKGTYHVKLAAKATDDLPANTVLQFTLTKDIPAGGQLAGLKNYALEISSYESSTSSEPLETVTVTVGSGGTDLGTLDSANNGALNQHRVAYGNNRYRDSAIRQYLNSDGAVGNWWTPQHNFDRQPDQLATKAGFLSGFQEDFLSVLKPVKIQVAANTICDSGETDVMYDKFFLPSLQEMHYAPQAADIEGTAWEYWKRASGSDTPLATGTAFAQMRTFALENHNSAQYVRLRSASRGSSDYAWLVSASGIAGNYTAHSAHRFAPACVIC